jgi:hypothetical protein
MSSVFVIDAGLWKSFSNFSCQVAPELISMRSIHMQHALSRALRQWATCTVKSTSAMECLTAMELHF